MKIIVAPDSFKGSLTAVQAAKAMEEGILRYDPTINIKILPAADGGEGTMDSLIRSTSGILTTHRVHDPLGRMINADYGVLGDGKTCVIEIAEASGLMLIDEHEQNPLLASSFGTGELTVHALDAGYRNFIIGLGGSGTNDAGTGMLSALGMKFLNRAGTELPLGGGALGELYSIDSTLFDKRIAECKFIIASDVENPLVGLKGASYVFGPQKGATNETVKLLDENLLNFANITENITGIRLHNKTGAGAAGGAGGAFQAFFPSVMKRGIDVVLNAISFDDHIHDAELILTGEGMSDVQTLSGKTPFGIAEVAQRKGKPILLISGLVAEESRELLMPLFNEVHSVVGIDVSVEESMNESFHYLKMKTYKVIKDYFTKIKQ
ncbi:glycerate kinase [Sporosarcina sp. Marseille-Q4063]|uniref:glycerate kinase n=1 Tax=Sporosarcina sp. Marseille-Q4063 TaxID=2810514 RepID=UPI001BAEAB2F|nr:glycerate kinase [Sporosarcina sp. Marseille-Q4063]QUW22415.1 glycerate kinase [Sporosarcina sp. Marseille-Q4063]